MIDVLDKQIEALKKRGLIFKDEVNSREIILRENYETLIRGYTDVFLSLKKKNHEFDDETYFEELYAIYRFDRELKNLFFSYLHIIETHIKSYIAYMFIDRYGNINFLREENFMENSHEKYLKLVEQISSNIERSYHEHININSKDISPLTLVKYFTFGNITNLVQILKASDKETLENYTGVSYQDLEECLRVLNIVRNICAHGDILFNIKIYAKIDDKDNKFKKHRLYSIIKILKRLLSDDEFNYFLNQFENSLIFLRNEIDTISYTNMLETLGIVKENSYLYKRLSNNIITYQPNPISTNEIELNNDMIELAEKLAENAHDIWAIGRIKENWKYGTIRDDNKKTTPDLVPYQDLSESEKDYDRNNAVETLKLIQKLGFTISRKGEY